MGISQYGLLQNKGAYDKSTSDFWDIVQRGGTRTFYENAFTLWNCEYLRPKHKIIPINPSRTIYMFSSNTMLKKIEAQYVDLSNTLCTNTSSTSGNYYTFYECNNLEEIEDVGLKAGYYYGTFDSCTKLNTIAKFRSDINTQFYSTFGNCSALANITIDGEIGQNGLSFKNCPLLTATSLGSILSALSTTSTGKTITFNVANKTTYDTNNPLPPELGSSAWDYFFGTERTNWTVTLLNS